MIIQSIFNRVHEILQGPFPIHPPTVSKLSSQKYKIEKYLKNVEGNVEIIIMVNVPSSGQAVWEAVHTGDAD